MKKNVIVIISILVVMALCVGLWFYGYHNRNSQDNLPSLAAISMMNEAEVNEILIGYHREQLIEVWGDPTTMMNNEYVWMIEDTTLTVSTNNKDKVVICGLSTAVETQPKE